MHIDTDPISHKARKFKQPTNRQPSKITMIVARAYDKRIKKLMLVNNISEGQSIAE
jgi:hypothetical protein